MSCVGRFGCGLLMVLNALDAVLGALLVLLGTFTPKAVSKLNSVLSSEDGSSDILEEEADRDFIHDRFWALSVPLVTVGALLLLSVTMSEGCRRCLVMSALLGILIGMIEVVMAFVAQYFFDDARKSVHKIVPCTLEQTCASDDVRCQTCQRDLLALQTLLDRLNEQVDWAVVALFILAGMQLVRACSGGLFTRFSALKTADPLDQPLLFTGSSVWNLGQPSQHSFAWSTRKHRLPSTETVENPDPVQRRQKYTARALRNGGSRSDFVEETLASGRNASSLSPLASTGDRLPSFNSRFSDQ